MASDHIVQITAENFQSEVATSPIPVVVDFWAEWCGPCRAIAPVLADLAVELAGKVKIAKVNVDELPDIAGQFGIRSIPTLLIFKGGTVAGQMVGAMGKAALKAKIEEVL